MTTRIDPHRPSARVLASQVERSEAMITDELKSRIKFIVEAAPGATDAWRIEQLQNLCACVAADAHFRAIKRACMYAEIDGMALAKIQLDLEVEPTGDNLALDTHTPKA